MKQFLFLLSAQTEKRQACYALVVANLRFPGLTAGWFFVHSGGGIATKPIIFMQSAAIAKFTPPI